jgi:hypothetical protein
MANCKVGDLAIIVIDEALQENLGITVQIVGLAGYIAWYPYSKRLKRSCKRPRRLYSWNVVALSSKGICYRNYYGDLYYRGEGDIPDAYLQRLPKLPAEKEVFSEEGIKSRVLCETERSDYETQV